MRELIRCLRPTGSLLLNLPAYDWMKSSHDLHVQNVRRYSARSARKIVERVGFRIAGVGYWNSLLFPLVLLYRLTAGRRSAQSDVGRPPAAATIDGLGVTQLVDRTDQFALAGQGRIADLVDAIDFGFPLIVQLLGPLAVAWRQCSPSAAVQLF